MAAEGVLVKLADGSTVPISADLLATLNGLASNGEWIQRFKPTYGADGDATDVSAAHPLPVADPAAAAALASILAAVDGLEGFTDGIEPKLDSVISGLSGLGTQTTAAAILAKLSSDPATQTTLAAVLAKLSSDPATQTTLAAVLAKLSSDPATNTTLTALLNKGPADLASSLNSYRKTVTTAGTAVALVSSPTPCKWVLVSALTSNTDQVNVGGSQVLAAAGSSAGTPLLPGASASLPVDNANKVFVDARVNGEGVAFSVGA